VIARFTQEDVYRGDGLNLYVYVVNNPLLWIDPSGYKKGCPTSDNSQNLINGPNGTMITQEYDNLVYGGRYARKQYTRIRQEAKWSAHGNKHLKAVNIEKAESLSHINAQYLPGVNNKSLEYEAMFKGIPVQEEGKNVIYYIYDTKKVVGYDRGMPTTWIRAELSSGVYHGHPMADDRVKYYLDKIK